MPAMRPAKAEWQRKTRSEFKQANGYSTTAHYSTGGKRAEVLQRDGHACVRCGMTDAQHKAKWARPITVDHISKDRSDNSLSNLQTLCLECHGRKDISPSLRVRKGRAQLERMIELRAAGTTYQGIADETGLSVATVWKYLSKEKS